MGFNDLLGIGLSDYIGCIYYDQDHVPVETNGDWIMGIEPASILGFHCWEHKYFENVAWVQQDI
jgi:hypothetical protein